MFDRKAHIEALKSLMKDSWSNEKIEEHADWMEGKLSKIKKGDNVIHLTHMTRIINESDLILLNEKLSTVEYELSSYDTSGDIMASAEDFIKDIILYLNQITVKEAILLGLGTNAIWDVIKSTIAFIYKKVKSSTTVTMSSETVTERRPSFVVTVNLTKEKSLEFRIDDIPENSIAEAVDGIKGATNEYNNLESNIPMIALYNPETKSWDCTGYTSEMLKKPSNPIRKLSLEDYIKEIGEKKDVNK